MVETAQGAKKDVYLALGSNLGDRFALLGGALTALAQLPQTQITQVSGAFRTAPIGPIAQDWFLNMCVALTTSLSAPDLLLACQQIERNFGRQRAKEQRWGPRTLDVDMLLYDGMKPLEMPQLSLPHPHLFERAFVLAPLLQILPATHPAYARAQTAFAALDHSGIELLFQENAALGSDLIK